MVDAVFRNIQAGPFVTIQDAGRKGMMRYGLPESGPMDRTSFAIAQAALGNAPNSPAIEISRGGLSLECVSGAVTFAVVGGGFLVQAGAEAASAWQVLTIKAGEKLSIKPGPWGSWTYLAFAGELQATSWLGSVATHSHSGYGGGRLVAGGELVVASAEIHEHRTGPIPCPVWARPRPEVRVVLGPQDRFFDEASITLLLNERFRLTDAYDRMGVRLRGPQLLPKGALSIPSEAIMRGSIQVSGEGTPTVLLADHQTTGGYPKIATVIQDDLDGFCQLRSHDYVRFSAISPRYALMLARSRAKAVGIYLERLVGVGVGFRLNR